MHGCEQFASMMEGGGMMDGGMSGAMWVGMLLWALLLLALIALAVAGTIRLLRSGSGTRQPSARDELDLRYARGELDGDEYFERRAHLSEER